MKTKRTKIFVIVIIVLSAAVILYALFGRSTAVDTAHVTLPPAVSGGESQYNGNNGNHEIVLAEVTPKTVQSVIKELSRAESYSRTVTVENFWDGGSSSTELSVWVNNGNTRIRLESGSDIKNILINNEQLFIWYENKSSFYTAPADGDTAEADSWLRCLTYEDLLALPVSAIIDAGYIEYAGESCIYAKYCSENFDYLNIVYVSGSTGLLMGTETFDGDTCIYKMSSSTPDISAPNAHMFNPPRQSG